MHGDALAPRRRRVGALEARRRGSGLAQRAQEERATYAHARGAKLHDHDVAVAIDHEPGKPVRFAVHETHCVRLADEGIPRAPGDGLRNPLDEERVVRCLLAEDEKPHADLRGRGVVSEAERLPFGGHHPRPRAGGLLACVENARHRAREHPGVTSAGGSVAAGEEDDVDHAATMGQRGQRVHRRRGESSRLSPRGRRLPLPRPPREKPRP